LNEKQIKQIEEVAHSIVEAVEEKLMSLSPGLTRDAEHLCVDDYGNKYIVLSDALYGVSDEDNVLLGDQQNDIDKIKSGEKYEHPNTMLHGMPYWTLMENIRDEFIELHRQLNAPELIE